MNIHYLKIIVTICLVVSIFQILKNASLVKAQQLESNSFIISNDELISGSITGNSDSFSIIGENNPLVGSLESNNFSQEGTLLGAKQSTPTPTPSSSSNNSSSSSNEDSSSSSSSSDTGATPILTPLKNLIKDLVGNDQETLPKQLFDIRIDLEKSVVARIQDLVVRVSFESFGTDPTPVDLTFTIVDSSDNIVYVFRGEEIDIIVETEEVYTKTFESVNLNLNDGNYTLIVTTLYNTIVNDEFRVDFTIDGPRASIVTDQLIRLGTSRLGIIGTTLLLLSFALFYRRKNNRGKNRKHK